MLLYNKESFVAEVTFIFDLQDTLDWGTKCLADFNAGKTQLFYLNHSDHIGAINVKMDWSVLMEKLSFKMLVLSFCFKLDWGSYIIFITKTASKKIGVLIPSMKFLSPEATFYLYKSTIRPSMESCQGWFFLAATFNC